MTIVSFAPRWWPRRMRTRLAVFYAVLFSLIGAVLLALTYGLSAKFLVPTAGQPPKLLTPDERSLLGLCKPLPASRTLLAECNHLIDVVGAGSKARGDALAALGIASVIGFGVLVVLAAVLGWVVAGRALSPVRSLTQAARRASELSLGQRLAVTGPDDELKELADTFDVMLERLDAAFTSQKRFVANAAHELRTPLTAMRTAIEVTLSKPARTPEQLETMAVRVNRSVGRAERTVEALLTLATSEAGPGTRETVDLATAAEDALDAAQTAIDQRRLDVRSELEPAPTSGDRVLLERMVANLVDNAVRHNVADGWVAVRTVQRDGAAVFEIANTGPDVTPEQLPTLFEPFARAAQRLDPTDGVGLGLSIASAVACAHDATINTRPRAGGGLEVSVTLPVRLKELS
jgi:signal transduction histidine kinase